MYIRVNVTAKSKREKVTRTAHDRYDITVREPAERNLANARIKAILAAEFAVSLGAVRMVSGHQSPHKIFSINKG